MKLSINSLLVCCLQLQIHPYDVFHWEQHNEEFKKIYDDLLSKRELLVNNHLEDKLLDNSIKGKEISIIFALKNRIPERYRDDTILNQIYLQTKELNFNFIQTQVNNLNNIQLLDRAKELSGKLEQLTNKPKKVNNTIIDTESKT
jgi:hypothetical protein